MHDEPIDQPTAAFLDEVRATFRAGAAPRPRPELAALLSSGLTNDNGDLPATAASNAHGSAPQTAGLPSWTRRHIDMVKDLMEQVRTRAVAAAVGAAVALSGLGASGALSAPMAMISDDGDAAEECVVAPDPSVDDGATVEGPSEPADGSTALATDPAATEEDEAEPDGCDDGDEVDDADDDAVDGESANDTADDEDDDATSDDDAVVEDDSAAPSELPAAPTSVSEAAHIHDFDEACGNHGAYVSHVARFGEEPECATAERGGAAQEETPTDGSPDPSVTGSEPEPTASSEVVEPARRGKGHDRQAAGAKGGRGSRK